MNSSNVTTGRPKIEGAVFRAPLSTELATDTVAALNEAFKELGYCSDAGMVNNNKKESEQVKAWGGDTVMSPSKGHTDAFKFTLIEATNVEVLKTVHGDSNVTGTLSAGITVKVNGKELGASAWTFDMLLRDGTAKRITIPKGTISEVGEVKYSDADPVGYEITLACEPDAQGNTHYEYLKAAV